MVATPPPSGLERLSEMCAGEGEPGQWAPQILSWNLTNRCNLRCAHCYLDAAEAGAAELSTEEALGVVDQIARAGTEMLILSGGEPLMRKDLFQVARHAADQGLCVVLGTNGTLITHDTVQRIRDAGVQGVGISLDSHEASQHDAFRRVPGSWVRAVVGIGRCVAAGIPVLVQATATPWNYKDIPELIRFAAGLGARGFTLYFLVCTGRGEALTDITAEQYEESLAALVGAQGQYPGMIIRARCAPQVQRIAARTGSALTASAGCLAGKTYGRITPEGDVTPCPYLPQAVGNVRFMELSEIWATSPLLQQLRAPHLSGRCGLCEFRQQCGGCRARVYATTADLWGEDPFCRHQPKGQLQPEAASVVWDDEARARLERVPGFIRPKVKVGVEGFARSRGYTAVSMAVMDEVMRAVGLTGRVASSSRPGDGEPGH